MIDNWRKSTYSVNNASCVETGWTDTLVGYRDTKQASLSNPPTLLFRRHAANTFLTMIKTPTT
ncbi:MAG TPA: DUF397 domain-containing protein [Actinophytocola sp.]|uniref:DUF397 domain-containing protein n=1 Tax=Actinophytocola sp. TaxID=1872138 RepID=UPI002DB66640|nr:DUF397 domain-containing protein [Actinophytocola sp.]HEU5470715.1 DUF397 domain-containing protein [Actinophytocola sp.]